MAGNFEFPAIFAQDYMYDLDSDCAANALLWTGEFRAEPFSFQPDGLC